MKFSKKDSRFLNEGRSPRRISFMKSTKSLSIQLRPSILVRSANQSLNDTGYVLVYHKKTVRTLSSITIHAPAMGSTERLTSES
uniref:Uncharacterized protein n=1 Tax=Pseudomonas phage KV2023 TaxID=3234047 RepID=A0AB39C6Y9_9CAUD